VMNKIAREFYERDTLVVAKELLGKYLTRNSPEGNTIGVIVETEAYIGPHDKASHAYNGRRTVRTQIQFGPGGYAYIYQIHGKHFCFCVVTQKIGMPEVVLVRALRPIYGIGLMMKRRGVSKFSDLANGPAKLCNAMKIDKSLYGADLCGDCLFITASADEQEIHVVSTPRINIDYAEEARLRLWRFLATDLTM
jgi:DNA-3-methyladenine glycosylase